ncbi:43366_t:CDS:2, partial [Gigaspora margarita]
NDSLQRKEDLSKNKVFGPLREILISSNKISEFDIVQESFIERLKAITPQKAENNKKTKRNYDNILQEGTENGITLSLPNTNKEDLQETRPEPNGNKQDIEIKKKSYSAAIVRTKSKQQKFLRMKERVKSNDV